MAARTSSGFPAFGSNSTRERRAARAPRPRSATSRSGRLGGSSSRRGYSGWQVCRKSRRGFHWERWRLAGPVFWSVSRQDAGSPSRSNWLPLETRSGSLNLPLQEPQLRRTTVPIVHYNFPSIALYNRCEDSSHISYRCFIGFGQAEVTYVQRCSSKPPEVPRRDLSLIRANRIYETAAFKGCTPVGVKGHGVGWTGPIAFRHLEADLGNTFQAGTACEIRIHPGIEPGIRRGGFIQHGLFVVELKRSGRHNRR